MSKITHTAKFSEQYFEKFVYRDDPNLIQPVTPERGVRYNCFEKYTNTDGERIFTMLVGGNELPVHEFFLFGIKEYEEVQEPTPAEPVKVEISKVNEPVGRSVTAAPTFSVGLSASVEAPTGFYSAFAVQEGGKHYKGRGIQPLEYIIANNLDFCQGNIVKYATRHEDKNGAEDIKKVIHYAQFLLETKYGIFSKVEFSE